MLKALCRGPLLAALALIGAAAVHGAERDDLIPFTATYSVDWHGMNAGISTLELAHAKDSLWTYRSTNRAHGIFLLAIPDPVTETSTFRIMGDALQPLSYVSDNGSRSSRNMTLHFDWDHLRTTGDSGGHPVDLPLEKGAQDNLSVQIALMRELRKGEMPTRFTLIGEKESRQYDYAREGEGQIDTALGRLDTIIYTSRGLGSPRLTRLWLAPSYGFLPVRGEQLRQDKREIEMRILSTTMPHH